MGKSLLKKNIYINLGSNLFLMVLGIIVPRIFITSYGSDVNGLLSTLTQIFTYMGLMEAGIGQAAKNALYKPIVDNDTDAISYVTSTASRYYRRICIYYSVALLCVSLACPFAIKTNIDHLTVFLVVIIEGATKIISFYFTSTYCYFLVAHGKSYINNTINIGVSIASYIAKILLALAGANIVLLQLAYMFISTCTAIVYRVYFRRVYPWLDLKAAPKTAKLSDRGSYVIESVSWLAYQSTDMIVLSIMSSTLISSVYAVYTMVMNCLNTVMNTVYNGVNYRLGQTYRSDLEKYKQLHDVHTSIFLGGITILLCTAYVLMIPFMKLYMGDITDANYVNVSLPLFFCLIQIITWSRYVMGNLAGMAGYQKQQGQVSIIEAVVNIVLTIALVPRYGIIGALIGSVVALPIKVVYLTWLCERKILNRNPIGFIRILLINYLYFGAVVLVEKYLTLDIPNYFVFIVYGICFTILFAIIGIVLNSCANPYLRTMISNFAKSKIKLFANNRGRYNNLDILKFFCALFVVCIHATFSWENGYIKSLYAVAVPLFFMITGFFYKSSVDRGRTRRQIKKVLFLIAISNGFYLLWNVLLKMLSGSAGAYIAGTFTWKSLHEFIVFNESPFEIHLWYLGALLYVLFIAQFLMKKNIINKMYWAIPLFLVCNVILGKYSEPIFGLEIYYLYSRNFLFTGLPFFLIGYCINERKERIEQFWDQRKSWLIIIAIIFVLTSFGEQLLLTNYDYHGDIFISTTVLAIVIFVSSLVFKNSSETNLFAIVGRRYATFMYVVHMFIKDFVAIFIPSSLTGYYYMIRPIVVFLVALFAAMIHEYVVGLIKKRRQQNV